MKFFRSLFLMSMAMAAAAVSALLPSVSFAFDQVAAAGASPPHMIVTTSDLFEVLTVLVAAALVGLVIIILIGRRLNRSGGSSADYDYGVGGIFDADPQRSPPS